MSLKKKIYLTFIALALFITICIGGIVMLRISSLRNFVITSNEELGKTAGTISADSVTQQICNSMETTTTEKAQIADNAFRDHEKMVQLVADTVTGYYNNESHYTNRQIALPDKANDGKLAVQLLYSEKTDVSSPEIMQEVGLLGNGQDLLKSINQNSESMASNYIATKSGIMIQADYISAAKFDADGKILPYEAATRPWYIGAMEKKAPFFTSISRDAHGTGDGIMCGIPFYHGDTIMGIAGAGMYLNNIKDIVISTKLGETGYACLMNESGQVIFSSMEEGTLSVNIDEDPDIRTITQGSLQENLQLAVSGKSGIDLVEIDGKNYYMAYAPMETVGWTFLTMITEEEVAEPTNALLAAINDTTSTAVNETTSYMQTTLLFMILTAGIACLIVLFVAYRISGQIVRPMKLLTHKVEKMGGDNLEFSWDLNTRDETQILAEAFQNMTEKMKQYIINITEITAEKEKIGAELNVAAKIQEDMLPKIFPPFPERDEFDIYANMCPAKAVGGDFYDFFMIDKDHIAFVIADVSSKGVPAALFMVIAKTLIKNHANHEKNLSDIFMKVNNQLCEGNDEGMFVTAWMAVVTISTGEMEYVNAGHNPMLWKHDGDTYDWIVANPGFVLAGMEGMPYSSEKLQLSHGDRIFLYTDGVSEAQNSKEELFGEDRLQESLNRRGSLSPEKMLEKVREDVDTFVDGAEQFDDITMLVFEYR